ncbi:M24 family metallopeptidase [Amaricoccus tamworthensis]|uniref:M24 family metallopeptidase n=1 Tax=Amaricoccus tamworthensis TaxID=57002 RepID=UPI003C79820E
MEKNLHFSLDEFAARQVTTIAEMQRNGIEALVLFRQESMYWLTGYDTFGYVHFQAMVFTAAGDPVLLTRSADRLQAEFTSVVPDVRIWVDVEGATPEADLLGILVELGLTGKTLGVEWEAYGLTAAKGRRVEAALADGFPMVDASLLITRLRAVKSPAEIAHVRRAAELADAGLDAAVEATGPGAFEGDILAELQGAIYRGGGDDPANEQIIGSGHGALMCRYFTGRRHLETNDLLTLEFAAGWRHYHAALMRTVVVGEVPAGLEDMHKSAHEALLACEEAMRPGEPAGAVFDAHAVTLDRLGMTDFRLNACGYSLGTTFAPNWMDWPMFYAGQSYEMRPGNVFFAHMILFDADRGLAMTLARTSLITETGAEPLSKASLEMIRR